MPKRSGNGSRGLVENVSVSMAVGIIRRVPKPAHSYGSPAYDLKKEAKEQAAKDEADKKE